MGQGHGLQNNLSVVLKNYLRTDSRDTHQKENWGQTTPALCDQQAPTVSVLGPQGGEETLPPWGPCHVFSARGDSVELFSEEKAAIKDAYLAGDEGNWKSS